MLIQPIDLCRRNIICEYYALCYRDRTNGKVRELSYRRFESADDPNLLTFLKDEQNNYPGLKLVICKMCYFAQPVDENEKL